MSMLKTVSIKTKVGLVLINESDYDPKTHTLFDHVIENKRVEVKSLKEKSKFALSVAKRNGATKSQQERADTAKKKASSASKELKEMEKGD